MTPGHRKELQHIINGAMMSPTLARCLIELIEEIERTAIAGRIKEVSDGMIHVMFTNGTKL